jgi:hypothetical protein
VAFQGGRPLASGSDFEGNNLAPGRTKPLLLGQDARPRGEGSLSENLSRCAVRPRYRSKMRFPANACGRVADRFGRRYFDPAPGHLAALMRRLSVDRDECSGEEQPWGNTIECESAEAALAVMLIGGREVAMIFADVRLPGAMGGVDLAWEVKLRWPLLPMILTSGHPLERIHELPPGVAYMPKPWQPLNVLIAAEQAAGR